MLNGSHFRYIKNQLDSQAQRTQKNEINKMFIQFGTMNTFNTSYAFNNYYVGSYTRVFTVPLIYWLNILA